MRYYSTNHQAPMATLEEAVVNGLAPDRGLYMPETIHRPGGTFSRIVATCPSASRNTMSIAKRMPSVWTALQRGKTYTSPSGSESRPNNPRIRSKKPVRTRARIVIRKTSDSGLLTRDFGLWAWDPELSHSRTFALPHSRCPIFSFFVSR